MKKLLGEYYLRVFSDGEISIEPINKIEEKLPSSRIRQVLNVIECTVMNTKDLTIETKINEAVNSTSQAFNIAKSSCIDKCSRQLGISMQVFKKKLEDYIIDGDNSIKEILLNNTSRNSEEEDINAINNLFDKLEK